MMNLGIKYSMSIKSDRKTYFVFLVCHQYHDKKISLAVSKVATPVIHFLSL